MRLKRRNVMALADLYVVITPPAASARPPATVPGGVCRPALLSCP